MADNNNALLIAAAGAGLVILGLAKQNGGGGGGGGGEGDPQILSFTLPGSVASGGTFWPEARLKLPVADSYRVLFQVDPAVIPGGGVCEVMDFYLVRTIVDPAVPPGIQQVPLDQANGIYNLRGWGYTYNEELTYDQALYQAVMAARAASAQAYQVEQAAWANVTAVESQIMASWPPGWESDPNWLYTHPYYSYPQWQTAHDAALAATDAYYAAVEAEQAALDALGESEVRTYTRELIPATARVLSINSHALQAGQYPVIGTITRISGEETMDFDFGQIGTLKVI